MFLNLLKVICCCTFLTGIASAFKVGVTAGPHALIMEKIKAKAATQGFPIEIIEFSDFIFPNTALNEGELDANSFQHQPFLEEQVKLKGYQISSVAKTVLMPLGLYSEKIKTVGDLPEGAKIAIPNDPTNGGRALGLLQAQGWIKLKEGVNLPCPLDIIDNPKKLKIIELEAPRLPMVLPDVDAAVINMDWVLLAKMDPASALVQETDNSPYVNIIAVPTSKKDSEDVKTFIQIYHSPEIKAFIKDQFKGAVLPAW